MVEDTKGLTLIETINGFNELSCLKILWTVRHLWQSGVRLALNCYCNKALLVVHRPTALLNIITSREGVTQGYPLLMVLYKLSLLTLA